MIKHFVLRQFTRLLDIFFIISIIFVLILGMATMVAGHGAQAFLGGLLTIIGGCILTVLYFGVIYLLVDIRDILRHGYAYDSTIGY